jgi:glycosyltransferase involved in cell wall biosynthesis
MTSAVQEPESAIAPNATDFDARMQGRRICMVVHAYYPLDTRVRREAVAAVRAGHSVDLICLRMPGEAAREEIAGMRVRRISLQHLPGAGAVRMVYEYLLFTALASLILAPAAVRRRYHVVHIHNPPDFLIVAAVLPRLFGSRVILDIHDLSSHMFRSRFRGTAGRLIGALLDAIELGACRLAHAVLTVHEPYRAELIAHGVPPNKVAVVMNVADQAALPPVDPHPSDAPAGTFLVAYCGTVAPWYGVELIIDAIEQLADEVPSVRALILGEGDALDSIRARVAASGLADRVELSGRWLPF